MTARHHVCFTGVRRERWIGVDRVEAAANGREEAERGGDARVDPIRPRPPSIQSPAPDPGDHPLRRLLGLFTFALVASKIVVCASPGNLRYHRF